MEATATSTVGTSYFALDEGLGARSGEAEKESIFAAETPSSGSERARFRKRALQSQKPQVQRADLSYNVRRTHIAKT
jgi:hypothetical protein